MLNNLRRNLIIVITLAVALYLGLAIYADFGELVAAFKDFKWYFLLMAMALVLVNYLVRFLKWQYLLWAIGIRIPTGPSLVIFFSGLTMTISPAKLGEVLKSFMLKDYKSVPVSRSSPIIVAERITDVIGLVVLGSAGALAYGSGRRILVITIILLALFIGLVQVRSLCLRLLHFSEHIPFIRRFAAHLEEFYEKSYMLLKARHLLPTTILSVIGWSFECAAAWLCLHGLGVGISILMVTFIFVIASLAGAVAMIPGGLGVTEASMTGLLVADGASRGDAVAATLLIRLATFWFAIGLGLMGVSFFQMKYGRNKGAYGQQQTDRQRHDNSNDG